MASSEKVESAESKSEPKKAPEVKNGKDDYRDSLLANQASTHEQFDKLIVILSGGGLSLSFTFLDDLLNSKHAIDPYFLKIAWVCWGMSLGAVLVAFMMSIGAHHKAIGQYDEGKIHSEAPGGNYEKAAQAFGIASGILFLFGLSSMIMFVIKLPF